MMIGDFVVRIGGEAWDLDTKNSVYVYQNNTAVLVGSIKEYVYLSGYLYYNTTLCSFGGSTVMGILLRLNVSSSLFVAIDMKNICAEGLCEAKCSPGAFQASSRCEVSPAGYVSEGFGT